MIKTFKHELIRFGALQLIIDQIIRNPFKISFLFGKLPLI